MTIADIKKTAEQKMARSIEAFKNELQKIRTGRAHPGILDQVQVDYYGSMVPISQVANVIAARRAHDQRPALGKGHGREDREGDPRVRPRPQPGGAGRPAARADAGRSPRSAAAT